MVSTVSPSQGLPPATGDGFVQVLVLDLCPFPQVVLQVDHKLHELKPPATRKMKYIVNHNLNPGLFRKHSYPIWSVN